MTALWSFNSIPIYVEDESISQEIKRAELFVLEASASTLHFFGAGSEKRQIKGIVIGDTNRLYLMEYAKTDVFGIFHTDVGDVGYWKINGTPKFERVKFAGAVLDGTTYTPSTPIYRCDIELIQSTPEIGP